MSTSRSGDAQRLADAVRTRHALEWLELELAAFKAHPQIQKALRHDADRAQARQARKRDESTGQKVFRGARIAWGLLLVALPVLIGFYSITGEGIGNRGPFVAAHHAIPRAGVLVSVAAVALLVLAGLDRARARRTGEGGGGVVVLAVLTSLAVLVMIVVSIIRGTGNDVPHWGLWLLPMVAYVVIGAFLLASVSAGPGVKGRRPSAAELAEGLPSQERESIAADIALAVKDLAKRGVISAREAELADDTELGDLTVSMAARAAAKTAHPRKKR